MQQLVQSLCREVISTLTKGASLTISRNWYKAEPEPDMEREAERYCKLCHGYQIISRPT